MQAVGRCPTDFVQDCSGCSHSCTVQALASSHFHSGLAMRLLVLNVG